MVRPLLSLWLHILSPLGLLAQQYNFAPNTAGILCPARKGDLQVAAAWSRNEELINFDAVELRATYAMLPWAAVQVNYMGDRKADVRRQEAVGTDYYLVEAGWGVFEKYEKGSASLFAGYGEAGISSYYGSGNSSAFDINRFYIQPSISYQSGVFQAGFAMRFSRIAHRSGDISFNLPKEYLDSILLLEQNTPLFRSEMALQVGIAFKYAVFSIHYTTFFSSPHPVNFVRNNFSISAALDLNIWGENSADPHLKGSDSGQF